MADDGGVLGNLPRSRPGHRSEKRTGKTAAQAGAAGRPEKPAAKASTPAGGAKTGAPKSPQRAATRPPRAGDGRSASRAGDPVGNAIRTAAGVAATGARVAGGVAHEVLRRLPRP
jgi:hypothetical protein